MVGQGSNWEQQARGILYQRKLKALELRVLRGLRTIPGCSSLLHSDKECATSWKSTAGSEKENKPWGRYQKDLVKYCLMEGNS